MRPLRLSVFSDHTLAGWRSQPASSCGDIRREGLVVDDPIRQLEVELLYLRQHQLRNLPGA